MATGDAARAWAPATAKDRRVRVLQVVAAPTRELLDRIGVNGPERRFATVAAQWAGHGVDVVVAYPKRGRLWRAFADSGVTLVDYEFGGKFDARAVGALAALIREHRADMIHTQGPGSLDGLAALAGRLAGAEVVVTRPVMIDDLKLTRPRRLAYKTADRLTLRLADTLVAVSARGQAHLARQGTHVADKIRLVYNGVDLERFAAGREQRLSDRPLTVGMVAQLTVNKGWFDFIEVMRRVVRDVPGVQAQIVGDGPLRDEIAQAIATARLSDVVRLVGHQENVAAALAELDLFLFTSHREGLSVAILEALASGLPIVATDAGGAREQVVEGRNGVVAAVGDVEAMAAATVALLRDAPRRTAFGRVSRELAEQRFSQPAMVQGYVMVYQERKAARRMVAP